MENRSKRTSSGGSSRFSNKRSSYGRRPSGGSFGARQNSYRGNSNFRRSRPTSGGSRGGRGRFNPARLNVSLFINKIVQTTETTLNFVPEHTFADFALEQSLKNTIAKRGYKDPTPIQDRAIPHAIKGQDIVGLAETGTGKTAAFLIPLINKILLDRKEQVLILTPTRELALQIEQELRNFTENMRIFSVVCVGGAPIGPQIYKLGKPNQFIIGTPGRVMDLMERNVLKLDNVRSLVLDEADRMLDMGFVGDMRFVMSKMPKERQTLFFSATMSDSIKSLINEFLKSPVTINVRIQDTSKNVDQDVVRVNGSSKIDVLHDLLSNEDFKKVLIFGQTKHGVEKLSNILIERGFKADSIHGGKSHNQRQRALKSFKQNQIQALVATDVAARGLDIDNVSHVINYELPGSHEDYIHRIGRTGRAGKVGKALTFID